jgi:hypothetical protein
MTTFETNKHNWSIEQATETKDECESSLVREYSKLYRLKMNREPADIEIKSGLISYGVDSNGMDTNDPKQRKFTILARYICLPDTIDPRDK